MNLWIVGKSIGYHEEGEGVWEFQGVFSSEALAVAACIDEFYFVGPAVLDEQIPDEGASWPGSYRPKQESA